MGWDEGSGLSSVKKLPVLFVWGQLTGLVFTARLVQRVGTRLLIITGSGMVAFAFKTCTHLPQVGGMWCVEASGFAR